jgi:formylmethanofuran dehydrogenase subunit E
VFGKERARDGDTGRCRVEIASLSSQGWRFAFGDSAMVKLDTCIDQLSAMHQHLCPKQVLGVRVGLYAAKLLGLDLPQNDKRVFAFIETDGCFTDGVSVSTGCWVGHRTLRIMDYGKVAATFVDTVTAQALRISPHPHSRRRALDYAPGVGDRWRAQLAAYQAMPTEELLAAHPVTLTISLAAILSQHGLRVVCARCGEDIVNQREVRREGIVLCLSCAGDRYYAASANGLSRTARVEGAVCLMAS